VPELPTFDPGFSTPEMTAALSARARVARMLEVESALAAVSARAGIISTEAAAAIADACAEVPDEPAELLAEGWRAGTPVIPLLEAIRSRLDPSTARWVHHGATSQDIVDTALVLQVTDALALLDRDLCTLSDGLHGMITACGTATAVARTLLQPALPIPFALRAARWLDPVLRHIEDVRVARRELPVQLGGPTGDLAAFGAAASPVVRDLADQLHLRAPELPWHTDRAPITTTVGAVVRTARTAATIAVDLALLAQPEIGEVRLRAGGSSSMPGKRNPIDSVRAIAAADACAGAGAMVTGARPHELERAAGGWHVEWFAVPLVLHTGGAAVAAVAEAVAGAEVDVVRAEANAAGAAAPDQTAAFELVDRVQARYGQIRGRVV
jgi:3-carboxy-cis,cis-muconate cycloisomerase